MPQKIEVLVPEATTNLVKNPSFEKDLSGWASKETENWDEEATFELGASQPLVDTNPTGFDLSIPDWDNNAQFETGDLSEFDIVNDVGGKLTVTANAAHDGAFGLEIDNSDNVSAFGQLQLTAINQSSTIASFWLNTNNIGIGTGLIVTCSITDGAGQSVGSVKITETDLIFTYQTDTGTSDLLFVSRTNTWRHILIYLQMSSGVGADDGIMRVFIDGVHQISKTTNDIGRIN